MHIIKKQLDSFSAAHRLVHGYQGKCKDLHGHDYLPELTLECHELDKHGFVMDFNDIKALCNNWVQQHLDHATLVCEADTVLLKFLQTEKQRYYVLPDNENSTVENLTKHLFHQFQKALASFAPRVSLQAVTIWESNTASATYSNS